MADKNINIKVGTTGARKAKQELGGLSSSITKMGKAVGIASAAYFGAKGLISSFSKVIELAGIQEQAEKKLEVALGRTSKALLSQASALQKVTTFGDESIIGVQASIAAFVDSEEAIKKATEATLDIAVAMGMDLKSAGDLVAKTLGSSTNAMSRYGIEVEGAVGSTERLESLTNNVANLFGGQAKAQAETMAGALDQAQNSAGDLAEAIGDKLSPFVKVLAADFKSAADSLTNFIGPQQISREEQLANLLRERSKLLGQITEKTKDVTYVSDLFTDSVFEGNAVQKETLDFGSKLLTDQIKQYGDLLYSKQQDLDITRVNAEESLIAGTEVAKVVDKSKVAYLELTGQKRQMLQEDLKNAALSGQSAKDAMKSVVRAETMEAVSGYIASVLKNVPFPANLVLAAGGGALVGGLIDKGLSKFATGGDFVTSGPQMIMVGDNPGGQERVQVTPLSSQNTNGPSGGITVNIQGGVIDESYVANELIPAINKSTSLGNKLNA